MKNSKLILFGAALILSTYACANSVEKKTSAIQGGYSGTDYCPSPDTLSYSGSKWVAKTSTHAWVSDTDYLKPTIDKPTIKFLNASVISLEGSKVRTTTGHIICTYKINSWEEIITLQPSPTQSTYRYASVINAVEKEKQSWTFSSYSKGAGVWRCSKGFSDCPFYIWIPI